jgi:1,4-dihydroxy-2-naphthoate octaprenyltransferase
MITVWIEASRPKTLICSAAPILLGSVLSFKAGRFSALVFLATLCAGLLIQILTNFANDYFDYVKGADTSLRKGPRRVTASGLASPSQMRRALFFLTLLTAVFGTYLTYLGGPVIGLLFALMLLLSFGYTTGPFPLAYLGLGELFVLLFFGPMASAGTYFLQTHHFSFSAAWLGLAPAFLATALISLNNLRDIDEDALAGKKTLAVRFGATFARVEYTAFTILATLLPCLFGYFLPLITLLPAVVPIAAVWKSQDLKKPFEQTGKLMLLHTLLLYASLL